MGLWSVNKIFRCFDPRISNSYSVSAFNMAVQALISVESKLGLHKSIEFANIRFFLLVPLCDCKSAAPIPKLGASHMALTN